MSDDYIRAMYGKTSPEVMAPAPEPAEFLSTKLKDTIENRRVERLERLTKHQTEVIQKLNGRLTANENRIKSLQSSIDSLSTKLSEVAQYLSRRNY